MNAITKYNKILITDYISYGKFYTCRPQNVHITGITLTPATAFVAAIMKLKARAGISFRNCEKSNDGNPQQNR